MDRPTESMCLTHLLLSRLTALGFLAASVFVASAARADQIYQVNVFCDKSPAAVVVLSHVLKNQGAGSIIRCAGLCRGGMVQIADVLAGFPAEVSIALAAQVEDHEAKAAAGSGQSIASCGWSSPYSAADRSSAEDHCKKDPAAAPGSVFYSGEITCDCNADGQDETTKSFESCGLPSSFPRAFKARCEDWVFGSGEYGYNTEHLIQRRGVEYIKTLRKTCPALKCQGPYASCKRRAESNYQKCLDRRKLSPLRPDCLGTHSAAVDKCEKAHKECLKDINRGGSDPRPQPVPAPPSPTPTPDRP